MCVCVCVSVGHVSRLCAEQGKAVSERSRRRRPRSSWLRLQRQRAAAARTAARAPRRRGPRGPQRRHVGATFSRARAPARIQVLVLLSSFGPSQYRTRLQEGRSGASRRRPTLPDPAWLRHALQTSGGPSESDAAIPRHGNVPLRPCTSFTLTAILHLTPGQIAGSVLSSLDREEHLMWEFLGKPVDVYSLRIQGVASLRDPITLSCDADGRPIGLRHLIFQPGLAETALQFADGASGP